MVGALVNHDDAVNDRTPKGKLDTSANETDKLWRQVTLRLMSSLVRMP